MRSFKMDIITHESKSSLLYLLIASLEMVSVTIASA